MSGRSRPSSQRWPALVNKNLNLRLPSDATWPTSGRDRAWADVERLRPDQLAALCLLAGVGDPAGRARQGEDAGEGVGREGQGLQQQRGVELHVHVQWPVGLALAQQLKSRLLD